MSQAYYPSPTSQDQRPTRTVNANGLRVECFFNADGKLEEKIVHYSDRVQSRYHYRFDDAGHLTQVFLGGREMERYSYNERGQRVSRLSFNGASSAYPETMSYNDAGRLTGAGLTLFSYNPDGSLRERRHVTFNTITRYSYGDNTMLDKVELPNRQKIRYEYHKERPLLPFRRFKNDELTMEYFWHDSMLLHFCMDHETQLQYLFSYTEQGVLEDIYLKPFTEDDPRKQYGIPCIINVGCDQVGTPILFLFEGTRRLCKLLQYDSFGNCIFDSKPDFFIPVGFAGGLVDKDTGLVRFGWRDYDPTVGRFTALDPARDRRGDGDLYDYCMDDPVTFVDPTGLWTQATFDESRVNRDEEGQFGSGGGGGSDGALTTAVNIGDAAVQAASQQQAVQFAAQTAQLAATAGDQIIPAQEAALQQQTVQLKENLGPPAASAARQVRHDTLLTRSNSEEPWDTTTPEEARSVKAALDHISPDKGDLRLNGEHDRNYQPVTLPSPVELFDKPLDKAVPEIKNPRLRLYIDHNIQPQEQELSWPEVLASAVWNTPGSLYDAGVGTVKALWNWEDTLHRMSNIVAGAVYDLQGVNDPSKQVSDEMKIAYARVKDDYEAAKQYYVKTYGSEKGFKEELAEHPANILSDASFFLNGGGSLLHLPAKLTSKGGKMLPKGSLAGQAAQNTAKTLEKTAAAVKNTGNALDPFTLTGKGFRKATKLTPVSRLLQRPGGRPPLVNPFFVEEAASLTEAIKTGASTAGILQTIKDKRDE